MNFLKDGLSLDESKVSLLMFILLSFSTLAIYKYITVGEIPGTLQQILFVLISLIAGTNIIGSITGNGVSGNK